MHMKSILNYISNIERISSIDDFIKEGIKINSKSKVNTIRYLSGDDVPESFLNNFTAHSSSDLQTFTSQIENKEYSPEEFIDMVRYKEQLFCYFFIAITTGWKEAYDVFREEIIDRKYATEDEIDLTAIQIYNIYNDRNDGKNIKDNALKYLKEYNVSIKDKK